MNPLKTPRLLKIYHLTSYYTLCLLYFKTGGGSTDAHVRGSQYAWRRESHHNCWHSQQERTSHIYTTWKYWRTCQTTHSGQWISVRRKDVSGDLIRYSSQWSRDEGSLSVKETGPVIEILCVLVLVRIQTPNCLWCFIYQKKCHSQLWRHSVQYVREKERRERGLFESMFGDIERERERFESSSIWMNREGREMFESSSVWRERGGVREKILSSIWYSSSWIKETTELWWVSNVNITSLSFLFIPKLLPWAMMHIWNPIKIE